MSHPAADTEHLTNQAELLKALAHPVRLAMLELFSREGALTVTEIHCKLGLEQAAASHHLSILKSRGIVAVEREGRNSVYRLRHGCLSQILSCLNQCNPPAK
jgi:DNA-binding transcriptional ArsR family regulator